MIKELIEMLENLPTGWAANLSAEELDKIHEFLVDRGEDADHEQYKRAIKQAWEAGKMGVSLDSPLENA